MKHVSDKHMPGGPKAIKGRASIFNEGENIVDISLEVIKKGKDMGDRSRELDMGRVIGISKSGDPTTKVKLFLNKNLDGFDSMYPL